MEKSWFREWRRPEEFLAGHAVVGRTITNETHRDGGNKWFREAKILGIFAYGVGATKVRKPENDPPDGEVLLAGRIVPIEVVEALKLGRKPHEEYKTSKVRHAGTVRQLDREVNGVRKAIDKEIKNKRSKFYPEYTVLVLYVNLGNDHRQAPADIIEYINGICQSPLPPFASVAIFWRNWLFGPVSLIVDGRVCIPVNLIDD